MPRLILTDGDDTYTFEVDRIFSIGRHPDNDLPLKDTRISRRHAEVRLENDHYRIVDLESLNGVKVNGDKTLDRRLKHGDKVKIGKFTLIWQEDLDDAGDRVATPSPFAPSDIVKPARDMQIDVTPSTDGRAASEKYAKAPEQLYVLLQVARLLNTTPTLDEFLRRTLDLALTTIDGDRGAILILEHGALRPRIQRGKDGPFEGEVPVSSTISRRVVDEGLSVLTSDARLDPRFSGGDSIAGYNVPSVLCVPLWEGERARGVLYLDNHGKAKAFTESDLDTATAIAHQVALGIRHHEATAKAREEAIHRRMLERYLSPDMVDLILRQPSQTQMYNLLATEREVTVLFCDIVGFSKLSARLKPAETANLLSHFFDEMTTVIFKHKGSVNKFMGDAVMAIWGAPFSYGKDEDRACRCAADMIRALYRFLKSLDEDKWFKVRIGINTGDVIAGNIGSTNMIEYTVIGDAVNVASRIEELAQPNQILIGERTREGLGSGFPTVDLGYFSLKGMEKEAKVYELIWRDISGILSNE